MSRQKQGKTILKDRLGMNLGNDFHVLTSYNMFMHGMPTQSVCVTDSYFISNVLDFTVPLKSTV